MSEHPASASDADLHAQAARAEAHAMGATTHVLSPRQRIFLPQSAFDRARGVCWRIVRATVFRFSPISFYGWRNLLLRLFGAGVGHNVAIAPSAVIEYPWNLTLGDGVVVCDYVVINCMGEVRLGARTRISQYAHLCAGTHDYHRPDMRIEREPITLGSDVWIAADAFVGPGVTINDNAMLAARSSAFHDLPTGMICLGEPARPFKPREADAAA